MSGQVMNGRIVEVQVAGGGVYSGPAAIQVAAGESTPSGAAVVICWRPLAGRRGVKIGDEISAPSEAYTVLTVERAKNVPGAVVAWCAKK